MIDKIIMYFYDKCLEKYGNNSGMYLDIKRIVYNNRWDTNNLAECFSKCKRELL